ncbi:MAG: hypothetical protein AB7S26_34480 [Sandaracinaceae bacterium]
MRALLHPVVLLSLAVWFVNDHFLKAALHDELTGKLSDVASLIVFPLLPVAAFDLWGRGSSRAHDVLLMASILATGLVMASINLFDAAADAYRVGLAVLQYPFLGLRSFELGPLRPVGLTMDPTDLVTLPALIVPALVGRSRDSDDPAPEYAA